MKELILILLLFSTSFAFGQNKVQHHYPCRDASGNAEEGCLVVSDIMGVYHQTYDSVVCDGTTQIHYYKDVATKAVISVQSYLGLCGGGGSSTDTTSLSNRIDINTQALIDTTTLLRSTINNHITADLDIDTTNEIQTISISNDTIYLEDGGFVIIPQTLAYNGVSMSGDTIMLGKSTSGSGQGELLTNRYQYLNGYDYEFGGVGGDTFTISDEPANPFINIEAASGAGAFPAVLNVQTTSPFGSATNVATFTNANNLKVLTITDSYLTTSGTSGHRLPITNEAYGYNTLSALGVSSYNSVFGWNALRRLTTGGQNTIMGGEAASFITTGSLNVGVGYNVFGTAGTTASQNVAFGFNSAYSITSNKGVFLGSRTAEFATSADDAVIIGQAAARNYLNLDNKLVIHNSEETNPVGSAGNAPLIYGDFSTRDLIFSGTLLVRDGAGVPTFSNAVFEVQSTTNASKPFPIMTLAQRAAIAVLEVGMHVYQTDGTEGVYVYKTSGWQFAY